MDIKELIKAVDTEGVLDKDVVETLVKNAEESILAKVAAAKEEGKKEGKEEALKEAECQLKDAEKSGYEKGVKATLTETETIVKEAEKSGYEAGVKVALEEAEALANEYDEQIKEAVKQLAEACDKYADVNVSAKIKETEDSVTDKVVESLDKYLTTYVKEVIPESVVIDYDRIKRLEKTFEVIKESLLVTDPLVEAKIKQLDESTNAELNKVRNAFKAEVQKRIIVENKLNDQSAAILLNEKLSDMPAYEKKILKAKFSGKSVKEINESFDDALAKIKGELVSESEKTKVTETVVTEAEEKDTAIPKKEEVVTESSTRQISQMEKYAKLAGKHSNFTAR